MVLEIIIHWLKYRSKKNKVNMFSLTLPTWQFRAVVPTSYTLSKPFYIKSYTTYHDGTERVNKSLFKHARSAKVSLLAHQISECIEHSDTIAS